MKKDLKIEFLPGAFDEFEGTQEELDELMKEIAAAIESGDIFKDATPVDDDDPIWEILSQKNQRQ